MSTRTPVNTPRPLTASRRAAPAPAHRGVQGVQALRVRQALLVLLALLPLGLAACQPREAIPADDLGLELLLPAGPVTPGQAFPLTVVARWSKAYGDLAPTLQLERAFPPLVLQLEQVKRREDALRVEEARTYRAYAMTRADVVLAPATWAPRPAAAPAVRAATPRTTVRVRPEVEADAPGSPEVPLPTLQAPRPRWLGWASLAAVLVLLVLEGLLLRRRHRTRSAARGAGTPGSAAPATHERSRLEALAGLPPAAQVGALAGRVRETLAQHGLPALARTTPETLALAPSLGAVLALDTPGHAALGRVLQAADACTYAREAPTPAAAAARLEDATQVLGLLAARPQPALQTPHDGLQP